MDIFVQIGVMIIIATLGAFLSSILRQPLIPAYILTGVILGPVLKLVDNTELIKMMSLIGIAFLLFIVGLELAIKKLKDVGHIVSVGTIAQVVIVFVFGFVAANFLGFKNIEAAYIGMIVAFSSTMVVVKLLSDKRELNTLHGKIIIGFLLMQDLLAILALSTLSSLNNFSMMLLGYALLKALAILIIAYFCSKFIFPYLFKYAAKSQELLFLLALSICFIFSITLSYLGFSIAIGAFVAGICLANLPYNIEIISKVRSLKDFFATLFFVSLGMGLVVAEIRKILFPLIMLVLLVVLLKPLAIMFISSFFGYTKKISFLTAISLAQISEFSIIIAAEGVSRGHISNELFTTTVMLMIITMAVTSYFIKYDRHIYSFFSNWLNIFDLMSKGKHLQYLPQKELQYDVYLIGYDRIGYSIFKTLEKMKYSFMVVDFNPDIIKRLALKKVPCLYGDISDEEVLERLDFRKAKIVVSTVPMLEDNLLLLKKVRQSNSKAVIFVTGNIIREAFVLYKAGADYVIMPHFLGGERVSSIIEEYGGDMKKVLKNKMDHLEELQERINREHEHPCRHIDHL